MALPTQVSIGIIGCGVVGTQVLEGLLSSRLFHVTCLSVSTRQPNHLPAYVQEGVQACYDNAEIASSADLLILAVLPTQFQDVARTVRGRVKKTAVVMSTLLGVSAERGRHGVGASVLPDDEHRCDDAVVVSGRSGV